MNMTMDDYLKLARNGGALLFCGSGFTAECLNFDASIELGVGVHLLHSINEKLKTKPGVEYRYKNLSNAAMAFKENFGEHGLLYFLKNRFAIKSVDSDMVDIVSFPWDKIYTTNFDNGIELAMQMAQKKPHPLNNLDSPTGRETRNSVCHIHGYIESWDINNFNSSCILDAEQYLVLSGVSDWLDALRSDLHRANLVVFVGFSASDFHLNRVIYDVTAQKEKIFFVNRPVSDIDPDNHSTLSRFGRPLYIGKKSLAAKIRSSLALELALEPKLASFTRYRIATPFESVVPVEKIENLFIFGEVDRALLARDLIDRTSKYHVNRSLVSELIKEINGGKRIIFVSGEICDGKSLLIECACYMLGAVRPVFMLKIPYEDILNEISGIFNIYPNACLIVENCFDIRGDRLTGIARMVTGTEGLLLLASRSISSEASGERLEEISHFQDFLKIRMPKLSDDEAEALVNLTDQFGGWLNVKASSQAEKIGFVLRNCSGLLPNFLLTVLNSNYVKQKYREEFNKINFITVAEKRAITLVFYMANIGEDVPSYIISNAFGIDVGALVDRLRGQVEGVNLIRREGDRLRAVPSIGSKNVLQHMIEDKDIVDSVVGMLEYLNMHGRSNDFEIYIFGQLMRYSILKSVVSCVDEINRFFDHISRIANFRRQILFWLQWHLAKTDQQKFVDAEKFLENSYKEAKNFKVRKGDFDTKQIDDCKSKFLMIRALNQKNEASNLFNEITESCNLCFRLLRRKYVTHHPFETLVLQAKVFHEKGNLLYRDLAEISKKRIIKNIETAKSRLEEVSEGYQRQKALEALRECSILMGIALD